MTRQEIQLVPAPWGSQGVGASLRGMICVWLPYALLYLSAFFPLICH